MCLNDRRQCSCVEISRSDPAGQLVVPDAVVPSNDLVVALRQIHDLLPSSEVKLPLSRLCRILFGRSVYRYERNGVQSPTYPFHAIAGGNLTELSVVAEDSHVRSVRELGVVCCRAEVDLSRSRRELVKLGEGERDQSRERRQQSKSCHFS